MSKKDRDKDKNNRLVQVILALAGILILIFGTGYYLETGKYVTVMFEDVRQPFKLLVADDEGERQKGLMFVKDMPDDEGMLFIFPKEEQQSFWMENTYIPLDIIFVNSDKRVVGVVENAAPMSRDSRKVNGKSKYVIELNGGIARRYGIGIGKKVKINKR